MDSLLSWIQSHAAHAHYALFFLAILAGINIPISIDLLMIIGATLAATVIREHLYLIFIFLFLGCALSAWIAYALGRFVGRKLLNFRFFSKPINTKQLNKMKHFYGKQGPFAMIIGRFIPFGIRNVLYVSSGMSCHSFLKFALWDGLACFIWSLASFNLYYTIGKNIDTLRDSVKWMNLIIFVAFSMTVIGITWYKKRKKANEENV
jgi:membrane protein DedA with SNARE-associated domain